MEACREGPGEARSQAPPLPPPSPCGGSPRTPTDRPTIPLPRVQHLCFRPAASPPHRRHWKPPSLLQTVPLHGPGQALSQISHTSSCTCMRTHTNMHTHIQNMHTCMQTHTCTHTHAKTKSRSLSLSWNNGVRAWWELTPSLPPVPHPATLQGDPGVRGQVGMPRGPGLTTRSSQERGQGGPQGLYSAPSVELQSVTVGGARAG